MFPVYRELEQEGTSFTFQLSLHCAGTELFPAQFKLMADKSVFETCLAISQGCVNGSVSFVTTTSSTSRGRKDQICQSPRYASLCLLSARGTTRRDSRSNGRTGWAHVKSGTGEHEKARKRDAQGESRHRKSTKVRPQSQENHPRT